MAQEQKAADDPGTPGSSSVEPGGVDAEALRRETELRAYYRHCARGCAPGSELDDWLAAEQEVLALHSAASPSATAASADDRQHRKLDRRQGVERR